MCGVSRRLAVNPTVCTLYQACCALECPLQGTGFHAATMQPALPTVDKDRVCVPETIFRPATKPENATTAPAGSTTDLRLLLSLLRR